MALWKQPEFPHRGWTLLCVVDLRDDEGVDFDDYENCQACDREHIRYAHYLRHPSWPELILAGCVCSGNLTNDYLAARAKEREARRLSKRRERFLARVWVPFAYGQHLKGTKIDALRLPSGKFRLRIQLKTGRRIYNTLREAHVAACDYLYPKHTNPK